MVVKQQADLRQQEIKKFLKQENSQQILDNLKAIPDEDALFETYIDLRVSLYEVKDKLKDFSISTDLQEYNRLIFQRRRLELALEQVEQDLLKPPTVLQLMLSYPGRFTFDVFETALEILRDYLATKVAQIPEKNQPTTQRYIWRTAGDKKVRAEHAHRAGLVFRYDQPPKGGNPGEDYGCRCWAEPIPDDWTGGLGDIFKR